MIAATDALDRLKEGNQRFISGDTRLDPHFTRYTPEEIVRGQAPFAVVLGCSDSRVPVEIIFDQGLGDIFVIRVAGNVVAASQIGSVEFATEQFGVQLVVVLGHTHCGAVQATLQELQRPSHNQSRNLMSIVDRIRPSVEGLLDTELRHNQPALEAAAVRSNVRIAANALRHGSQILEQLVLQKNLLIVGAEYSLASGTVEFFDGVP